MKKEKLIKILYWIFISIWLWVAVTSSIQSFKCPEMTRTEAFLHIPNSFILNWADCSKY